MSRSTRPRKAYRPRPAHLNAVQTTLNRVGKLTPNDLAAHLAQQKHALAEFPKGVNCQAHWLTLVDAVNMAETMAGQGLCSGPEAAAVLQAAQRALSDVCLRHEQRGTWTLYPAELDALRWMLRLHHVQLTECGYGEFDRAVVTTQRRISQAVAGNAGPGVILVGRELA